MSLGRASREDVLETLRMLQHSASRLQHRIDDAIHQLKNIPSSDLDYFVSKQRDMIAVWCEEELKILDELGSVQSQQQTEVVRVEARHGRVQDNGTGTNAPLAGARGQALLGGSPSFISRDADRRLVQHSSELASINKIVAMGGVPALGGVILQPDHPQEANTNGELIDGENA